MPAAHELENVVAPATRLRPIALLPDGTQFQPHKFAGQWLSERGLAGDAQVQVTYQEVETIDSAAASQTASVPLQNVVTQGFLLAYQSKERVRDRWTYPHISQMTVDFSSLRVDGRELSQALLSQLKAGIVPGYQGTGAPLITERDAQGNLLSVQEKGQIRQLELLDDNQAKLARLFAGVPTFDTVFKNLLVSSIKNKIALHLFRPSLLQAIDPDNWYVNRFTTDASGMRSITSSRSFTHELWACLNRGAVPIFSVGAVGFFTRPDTVEEVDSVFANPADMRILRVMETVFYVVHPTTNDLVKRQFHNDFLAFRASRKWADSFDTLTPVTAEAALADLLSRRFLHLLDLYRFDQIPESQLTPGERTRRSEQDRLLDIITTHPSKADRDRMLRTPIPHVYDVMLDMGDAGPQKWPAAMVIKRADEPSLVLYSLEGGLQRFPSFQGLVNEVNPVHGGQKRTIQSASTEQTRPVFERQADELLQTQYAALERVLNAPKNETLTLEAFAKNAEDAFALSVLSLEGPLDVRNKTLIENNRSNFYKSATSTQKETYRRLENEVVQIAAKLGRRPVLTLTQFSREKITHYLQQHVHPGIEPDPDKTPVTLFHGDSCDPKRSRTTTLTQLMLDNLRPEQYSNTQREVLPVHLMDKEGERIRNPANGYFFTLTGRELAVMATRLDVGGNYEVLLRKEMNKPDYKADWQAAYLANMRFKGYEAALRGDEVFKTVVIDQSFDPPASEKKVALWLDAVLKSPKEQARAPVMGRRVNVFGLVLGGSVGAGGQHGTLGNAISIDGALIFSDQDGPDIKGVVGVYLPDSPDGNDVHEFSDLGDGIAQLLQQEEWQAYFRSRISTLDPDEIQRTLGQREGRPLIRGSKITGDCLEVLHRAHVSFHSAYADHRSNSNLDVRRQTGSKIVQATVEAVIDVATMILVPGYQLLNPVVRMSLFLLRPGSVSLNLRILIHFNRVMKSASRVVARTVVVPVRGQSTFLALTARQSQAETLVGLPLEKAVYGRYAVQDASVIKGMTADAQGFYRAIVKESATGKVLARPVYIRQPDGTVLRVHDHTKLTATEATLVDPVTGLSIRSSGVTRSTVARMADGEWRGVGFGRGGGKRLAASFVEPGPSKVRAVSTSIRTPGSWDHQIMDLVPSIMTRLGSWPQNRSLLIIDQIASDRGWSMRFTPGQPEITFPMVRHPGRTDSDIVLMRMAQNHYSVMLRTGRVDIPRDGDCFFNAVAQGLNEGQLQPAHSIQGLRNAAADYIDQHPELSEHLVRPASAEEQALFDYPPTGVVASVPHSVKIYLPETARVNASGLYAGTYEVGGKHYVKLEGNAYQVASSPAVNKLRIIDPDDPGVGVGPYYVRKKSDGAFELEPNVGFENSTLASEFVIFLIRQKFPQYTYDGVVQLLSRYNFPAAQQITLQLQLAEHYIKQGALPLAFRRYLKPGLVDSVQQFPPEQEARLDTHWEAWGRTAQEVDEFIKNYPELSADRMQQSIKIGEKHYEVLPQGYHSTGSRLFIRHPKKWCESFDELEALIRKNKYNQPREAEWVNNQWVIHEPMFEQPVEYIVGHLLQGLTPESRYLLAKRLYKLADDSTLLTSKRLLRMRAILETWRADFKFTDKPIANDPFSLLKPTQRGIAPRLFGVGVEQMKTGFYDRLDFTLLRSELYLLNTFPENMQGLKGVLKSVLARHGYKTYDNLLTRPTELIFRRPGFESAYYMQLSHLNGPIFVLDETLEQSLAAFILRNSLTPYMEALGKVNNAGTFIMLLGGVQRSASTSDPVAFVYRP